MPFKHTAGFKLSLEAFSESYVEFKSGNTMHLPSETDVGGTTEVTRNFLYFPDVFKTEVVDGKQGNEIEFNIEGDYSVRSSQVAATFIIELNALDKKYKLLEHIICLLMLQHLPAYPPIKQLLTRLLQHVLLLVPPL